jgi:hypothetical protein
VSLFIGGSVALVGWWMWSGLELVGDGWSTWLMLDVDV